MRRFEFPDSADGGHTCLGDDYGLGGVGEQVAPAVCYWGPAGGSPTFVPCWDGGEEWGPDKVYLREEDGEDEPCEACAWRCWGETVSPGWGISQWP